MKIEELKKKEFMNEESGGMFRQYPFGLRRLMDRGTFLTHGIAERLASGEDEAAQFRSPVTRVDEHVHFQQPFRAHQPSSCPGRCTLLHPRPPKTCSRHYTLQPSLSTRQPWYPPAPT